MKIVEPFPYQYETLTTPARFVALMGGTGGGKTWWGSYWLADRIRRDVENKVKNARYLALAPTAEMARDKMVPYLTEAYKGTVLQGEYRAQPRIYYLPTGGQIFFRSAEKPERVEGDHFRAIWIDEPGQVKALAWSICQTRAGFHSAPILLTGYPWNMGWYYQDFYKRWQDGDPDYHVIQFDSTANPMYPEEEYERAKATLPEWEFEMRYRGKFRKPAGLVYPDFNESLFVEPFELDPRTPTYVGLDPGVCFGGVFAAWINGTYYIYDEYYTETLQAAPVHSRELQSRARGIVQAWIYDPARLTDVNELHQHGVAPLAKASNPVMPGISTVTQFIKSGRLKIFRGACPNLVDQMERYTFRTAPDSGRITGDKPVEVDDHLPDCLRYVLHSLEGARSMAQPEHALVGYHDGVSISPY